MNRISYFAFTFLVAAGIFYGSLAFDWKNVLFLLSLAPYGIVLGAFWHKSFHPFAWGIGAATAGMLGFPMASAFC